MKRTKLESEVLINDLIEGISQGMLGKMSPYMTKKYNISPRQYRRYEKYALAKISESNKKVTEYKRELAEAYYNYKIIELKSDLQKEKSEMSRYQAEKLMLEARRQLNRIQGLEIQKIEHSGAVEIIISKDDEEIL